MKGHLLWIESSGKEGKPLGPPQLADVLKSIKALGGRAGGKHRPDLKGKTIGQMLEEAARHPDVARALAAMGG
jgi:hypothetical protein